MARFRQARRLGRDQELGSLKDEIASICEDPSGEFADILGVLVDHADPDQMVEIASAARELVDSLDRGGGPARWAEDRRFARDQRRRLGRDDPEPFSGGGMPRTGGSMDPIEGEDRRRRMAGDRLALDSSSPRGQFARLFPRAVIHERV
jgi:hypothetical protein